MNNNFSAIKMAVSLCTISAISSLCANPTNPSVISGNVSFGEPNSQTLNVTSTSSRSIVEWEGFSIDASQETNFNLPASSSVILNRVTSSTSSSILGNINSNGQVYLINPNGILIGANSVINTAAFLASTLDTDNTDFLNASDLTFLGDANSDTYLVNAGALTAEEGDIILLSYQTTNTGTFTALNGTVGVGAGVEIILQPNSQDNRILIIPHDSQDTVPLGVDVAGYINSLRAELTADGNFYALAIKHAGSIDAQGLPGVGSTVLFTAVDGATSAEGSITALNADNVGGTVAILGDAVDLTNSCQINALGAYGGGAVYIGGGWQGNDPAYINATTTLFETNAQVQCDATSSGSGGTVVVWADDSTNFQGTILARGGQIDGDGGRVEVSGVNSLSYTGTVDVTAPNGEEGVLVLDPKVLFYQPREVPGLTQATPIILP